MEFLWILPTVIIGIGLVIFFLGYTIRVYKKYHLIAGFKESTLKDKIFIANWIGGMEIFGGLVDIALGILALYLPKWTMTFFVSALFFTIFIIMITAFSASKLQSDRDM